MSHRGSVRVCGSLCCGSALAALAALLLGVQVAGNTLTTGSPRPLNATNITVYHVNQANWSVAPINMNTADVRGDIYFDLTTRDLPVECSGKNLSKEDAFDCQNQEAASSVS